MRWPTFAIISRVAPSASRTTQPRMEYSRATARTPGGRRKRSRARLVTYSPRRFGKLMDIDPATPRHATGALRAIFIVIGVAFMGLGVLGIMLPLMPGTPFLIVALYFFARSSARLRRILLENRWTGPLLHAWIHHRSMPPTVKPRVIALVILAFGLSAVFALEHPWARAGWVAMGVCVLVVIWRVPVMEGAEG